MKEYKASYNFFCDIANKKGSETVEGFEGVLLDNYLITANGRMYFFRETPVNCWQSEYTVREYGKKEVNQAFEDFYNCQDKYIING